MRSYNRRLVGRVEIHPVLLRAATQPFAQWRGFSPVLNDPAGAGTNDVRDGALHCFNMLLYQDPTFDSPR
jgi:hypothetical protein